MTPDLIVDNLVIIDPKVVEEIVSDRISCDTKLLRRTIVRRFRRHRSKFLEARIVPERIEHWIELEQRRSERYV